MQTRQTGYLTLEPGRVPAATTRLQEDGCAVRTPRIEPTGTVNHQSDDPMARATTAGRNTLAGLDRPDSYDG